MRVHFLLLTLLFSLSLWAEGPQTDKDRLWRHTSTLASEQAAGRLPGTEGHRFAREYITKVYKELGLKSFDDGYVQEFEIWNPRRMKEKLPGKNVVGYIPGTKHKDRFMVLSAHYDHLGERNGKIHYGADDNAAGVAAMLEIAHYFSRHPAEHGLIFVAFDGEEAGLRGARHFVEHSPVPLTQIVLNINMDMISRAEGNLLWAVGTYHYPFLRPVLEETAKPFTDLDFRFGHDTPDSGYRNDWTVLSDQAEFHKKGIPVVFFSVEDHEDYHQPTDTLEGIMRPFFFQVTDLILQNVKAFDLQMVEIEKNRETAKGSE